MVPAQAIQIQWADVVFCLPLTSCAFQVPGQSTWEHHGSGFEVPTVLWLRGAVEPLPVPRVVLLAAQGVLQGQTLPYRGRKGFLVLCTVPEGFAPSSDFPFESLCFAV